ncbi:MAG: hypothetical protein AB1641_00855 [Thermodesulfobacteriota bacterium]
MSRNILSDQIIRFTGPQARENCPPYQALYNGAIEHPQGEFKTCLGRWEWEVGSADGMILLAEIAAHDLNHQPRRCLEGMTACRAYFGARRIRCPGRWRKAVHRWIQDLAAEISIRAGKPAITPLAWPVAAKQWLVKNGLIGTRKAGKVLPDFSLKMCHNQPGRTWIL